ncbi:hypothetical protein FVE85_8264 [Porphyridium purpureum]|uniref:EF-hand domain-containing protein n=1 Tax=Porphyridium purpureum TaxID=35688 RepID=A0A5J4YLB8_PORPP|nr:hypothetical protein FVE85_8264 [Porphyridium purpureum]|eukprot:POR4960..scf244_11
MVMSVNEHGEPQNGVEKLVIESRHGLENEDNGASRAGPSVNGNALLQAHQQQHQQQQQQRKNRYMQPGPLGGAAAPVPASSRVFKFKPEKHGVNYGMRVKEIDSNTGEPYKVVCRFCESFGRAGPAAPATGTGSDAQESIHAKKRQRKLAQTFPVASFYLGNVKRHLDAYHKDKYMEYRKLLKEGGHEAIDAFFANRPADACASPDDPVKQQNAASGITMVAPGHTLPSQPFAMAIAPQPHMLEAGLSMHNWENEFVRASERNVDDSGELSFEQAAKVIARVTKRPSIYPSAVKKLEECDMDKNGKTDLDEFLTAVQLLDF